MANLQPNCTVLSVVPAQRRTGYNTTHAEIRRRRFPSKARHESAAGADEVERGAGVVAGRSVRRRGGSGVGVTLWDVEAGTPGQHVLDAGHGGEAMVFCPVTSRLYVAFRSGGFWTVDPDTGAERRRRALNNLVGYSNPAVSADGRTVVLYRYSHYSTAPSEHAVIGYDVSDTGALPSHGRGPILWPGTPGAGSISFGRPRTNQLFGLKGKVRRTRVRVGDRNNGRADRLAGVAGQNSRHAMDPLADGDRVAWLAEQVLCVQRLDGSAPLVLPAGPDVYRRGLTWAPDGRTLAYTSGRTVQFARCGHAQRGAGVRLGHRKARTVAFSPDGLRAAVSADGGRGWVTVFDLE